MKILLISLLAASGLFGGETITAGNFVFTAEKPWTVQETQSHMVKGQATYGEKGPLLKFYHFGAGQGGGVGANVKRWEKQFGGDAKVATVKRAFEKQEVTVVTMEGTYLDGPMMGKKTPKADYVLLGAIIPHASGDVFLKMTGPKAEVEKAKVDFDKIIASAFEEASENE